VWIWFSEKLESENFTSPPFFSCIVLASILVLPFLFCHVMFHQAHVPTNLLIIISNSSEALPQHNIPCFACKALFMHLGLVHHQKHYWAFCILASCGGEVPLTPFYPLPRQLGFRFQI
jgi:hypothetical protein